MRRYAIELLKLIGSLFVVAAGCAFIFVLLSLLDFCIQPAWSAETRLRVAVIDTGLDLADPRFAPYLCADGHHDFTGHGIRDAEGHGTRVAGLIVKNGPAAGSFCLMIEKYYDESAPGKTNLAREVQAVNWAAEHGARYVNISGGGPEFDEQEYLAIRRARETWFIVAGGNDGENLSESLSKYYPASYPAPNVVAVGALDASGTKRLSCSNYGGKIAVWEIGENVPSWIPGGVIGMLSGTSQATAIHTGRLVRAVVTGVPLTGRATGSR